MSEIELITATPELLVELGTFLQGPPGATGATGPQGAGIIFKGEVATSASLPTTASMVDLRVLLVLSAQLAPQVY
jgi:hypothetical protein